jgi:hypothetical protein
VRFVSLDTLLNAARDSLRRFPETIVVAVVAAVAGIVAVETKDKDNWERILLASQLGVPLMFVIALTTESRGWTRPVRAVLAAIAALLLAAYYFTCPDDPGELFVTRHVQLTVGLHLLVAFAPFATPGRLNAFWQYNRSLFLRFLTAAVYSVVLYAGLAVALLALDQLLGIGVHEKLYLDMWVTIAFVVNTWVFAGGVPRDLPGLEQVNTYSGGIKVFAQYILVPIVIVYLVILTMYLVKVLVTQVWPSGWIGWLVSSVAVVGILAHLLVHPVRDAAGNQWVRTYSRWFYAGMLPAVVMLLMAIGKRIGQYGFTERRYLLVVLAVWLAAISIYFVVSRSRNIKLIPVTLCFVAFATSFGPWGAFAVSQRSQVARLEGLLERNDILVDGSIQPAPAEVPFEDRREISGVLDYLASTHGTDRVDEWLGDRLAEVDSVADAQEVARYGRRGSERVRRIMDIMEVEYTPSWAGPEGSYHFTLALKADERVLPLDGADVLVRIDSGQAPVNLDGPERTIAWDRDSDALVIAADGETVRIGFPEWAEGARIEANSAGSRNEMTAHAARIDTTGVGFHATVVVLTATCDRKEERVDIVHLSALCALRWIRPTGTDE